MKLDGKVALVTGGALRVGRYLSLALARAGADVVVNYYRTPREAEETRVAIEALGRRCLLAEADVGSIAETRQMIGLVEKEFGRLDILVHNAGNFNEGPFLEMTEGSWDSSMNLILKGPFFLSQAAAKLMLKNGSGRIMAIVGNSLYENWPNFIPHAIAKTGLAKLMQELAIALSPRIQCNAICPATILPGEHGKDAEMRKSRGEERENVNVERGVTLHMGNPEELAELVVYLSGCSDYLTGAILPLDGGKSAL
jgi:NAD(P)-dependent dehydrogenase (short-subunit alcohol dehydrogenase family)